MQLSQACMPLVLALLLLCVSPTPLTYINAAGRYNNTLSSELLARAPPAHASSAKSPILVTPQQFDSHWSDMKGAKRDGQLYLNPNFGDTYEIADKTGKALPLIQLDCQNGYTKAADPRLLLDVCKNFCFYRHCDPSSSSRFDVGRYEKFTRSKTKTNTIRREVGGYLAGDHGPCSFVNKGAKKNFFHGGKADLSSLDVTNAGSKS